MIKLCHAFASLMDLYGDYANMKVLAKRLENSGETVKCETLPRFEGFNPDNTDMLFIGPGTELSAVKACEEISSCADEVKRFLDGGGTVLLCGNAAALFGKGIAVNDFNGTGLGIIEADFKTAYRLRRYTELLAVGPWGETVGSINSSCTVKWGSSPLFEIKTDTDKLIGENEGSFTGNIYATELTGPLLVNNPGMCDYFAEKLAGHNLNQCMEKWYEFSTSAHNKFVETLKGAASK